MALTIAALYRFTPVADAAAEVADLRARLFALGVRGTLLVAPEGVNGTLAGSPAAMEDLLNLLGQRFGLPREEVKFHQAEEWPFKRLKVRLKKEIITFRQPQADPSQVVGQYVEARDWNRLLDDPDVLLLDTRNLYEVEHGTFAGAVIPSIDHFTQFAAYVRHELAGAKDKKIAMFCTGGIRCEKASSFMLQEGFGRVYHLKGGILKYLQEVPEGESRWQGKCFVFDEREAV